MVFIPLFKFARCFTCFFSFHFYNEAVYIDIFLEFRFVCLMILCVFCPFLIHCIFLTICFDFFIALFIFFACFWTFFWKCMFFMVFLGYLYILVQNGRGQNHSARNARSPAVLMNGVAVAGITWRRHSTRWRG